jgi:hypothetical protein
MVFLWDCQEIFAEMEGKQNLRIIKKDQNRIAL